MKLEGYHEQWEREDLKRDGHVLFCYTNQTIRPLVFNLGYAYPPGVHENILGVMLKYLTSIKTKHGNLLNLEPALILTLNEDSSPNWGAGMPETGSVILLTGQNHISNWYKCL
jgi:hypothetical protein